MRAIIIGAGRGRRLMPTTADTPKCFAEVQGTRILDWDLHALSAAGISDVCFIGGYRIEKVRADYPHFTFRHNTEWEHNNILASLMYAGDLMNEPFLCTYSDVLFTADVVQRLLASPADIALSVDTEWLDRYRHRSNHPATDAEKVTVANGYVTRVIEPSTPDAAHGEYTGIAKFSRAGAATLKEYYHRCRALYAGKPFREAETFEKAYLIQLFQDMIEVGRQDGARRYAGKLHGNRYPAGLRVGAEILAALTMARLLFPASVVGSMPRSTFVQDLINDDPPLPPERHRGEMDAAVRYIVAVQEYAGLDVVTDGEWRRKSYIGVIAELAHGFELGYNPLDRRPWTVVVDKLAPKQPGFMAEEIAFLKRITSRQIKATLPAPALLGERLWDPEKSAKAYPKREDFVRDCVPILRRELELIGQAGADIVQIDDPHLCLFVDPAVCAQYDNADAAADFAVDMINAVLEGGRTRSSRCICAAAPERAFAARRNSRAGTIRSSSS